MSSTLQRELWSGPQTQLSVAWILTHEHRTAECSLWSHPLGWELRVAVNGSTIQTQVAPDPRRILESVATWQRIFLDAGWADRSSL